jgi:hypothetical protein
METNKETLKRRRELNDSSLYNRSEDRSMRVVPLASNVMMALEVESDHEVRLAALRMILTTGAYAPARRKIR